MSAYAKLVAAAADSHEANVKMVDALADAFGIKDDWDEERIYDSLPSSAIACAYFAARAAIRKVRGDA